MKKDITGVIGTTCAIGLLCTISLLAITKHAPFSANSISSEKQDPLPTATTTTFHWDQSTSTASHASAHQYQTSDITLYVWPKIAGVYGFEISNDKCFITHEHARDEVPMPICERLIDPKRLTETKL